MKIKPLQKWAGNKLVECAKYGLYTKIYSERDFKGYPHASIMYQDSGQNSYPYEVNIMGGCVNIMGSCVSFQIKVQILAFYTVVCTAPYSELGKFKIPGRTLTGLEL